MQGSITAFLRTSLKSILKSTKCFYYAR